MKYNLGVVGLGHWFSWLEKGIGERGSLNLIKAVGTKPFEEKKELLSSFKISEDNYYISGKNGELPNSFFEGLELVHISDPNKFHSLQAIESLKNNKHVIVEKTLATNEKEFNEIKSLIKKENLEDRIYLHLHYLHKQATIALLEALPGFVEKYGKIKSAYATFFEPVNGEDPKRTWVLSPENGGIFMDWIHPFEVLYYTTGCSFGDIVEATDFAVNEDYDPHNPTGVRSLMQVNGKYYSDTAVAEISFAKGTGQDHAEKSIKLVFESGCYAIVGFPGHDAEFNDSWRRGALELFNENGEKISSSSLSGMNSSEIFISEVIDFCNGKHRGLNLDDISKIFKPQWDYQNTRDSRQLVRDKKDINIFLDRGLEVIR